MVSNFFFTVQVKPYIQTSAWLFGWLVLLVLLVLVVLLFFPFFEEIMIHEEIRENMKAGVEPLILQLQQGKT